MHGVWIPVSENAGEQLNELWQLKDLLGCFFQFAQVIGVHDACAVDEASFVNRSNLIDHCDRILSRAWNRDDNWGSGIRRRTKWDYHRSGTNAVDFIGGKDYAGASLLYLRPDGRIEIHPPDLAALNLHSRSALPSLSCPL